MASAILLLRTCAPRALPCLIALFISSCTVHAGRLHHNLESESLELPDSVSPTTEHSMEAELLEAGLPLEFLSEKRKCGGPPGEETDDNVLVMQCDAIDRSGGQSLAEVSTSHRRVDLASRWDSSIYGGRACNVKEYVQFAGSFHRAPRDIVQSKAGMSNHQPCNDKNVLWLYPKDDHNNAFAIDLFICHRLRFWLDRSCSVRVERVGNISEAAAIVRAYPNGSIGHLVLGGHGSGSNLHWGPGGTGQLAVHNKDSEEFLKLAAGKMHDHGTIFLDSCFAATMHEMENLAHYTARVVTTSMPSKPGEPAELTVFGSVHSLINSDLKIEQDNDTEYQIAMANSRGTQVYTTLQLAQPQEPLDVHDWVRAYFFDGDNKQSLFTDAGIVTRRDGEVFDITFRHQGPQFLISKDWVTQYVNKFTKVDAYLNGVGREPTAVTYLGPGKSAAEVVVRLDAGGDRQRETTVDTDLVRPIVVNGSGAFGADYPDRGAWVRVEYRDQNGTHGPFAGLVISETKLGMKARLGKSGQNLAKGPLEFLADEALEVADFGAEVLAYYSYNASARGEYPARGVFVGGDSDRGLLEVKFDGLNHTVLLDPDWLVAVRSDADIFRTSVGGCPCARVDAKTWQKLGMGQCDRTDLCCNRDSDAAYVCTVENSESCGGAVQPCRPWDAYEDAPANLTIDWPTKARSDSGALRKSVTALLAALVLVGTLLRVD